MPHHRVPIHRIHSEASAISDQIARMRDEIARALEILKAGVPDTFLGRRTQEPFPSERGEKRNR
ncbi:hypothetical protein JQ612_08875 [Bradyrhizobium manausense]|uniref:hypothetical protein n=1 Tax=Bradyrhizobium manausense TaxID=989370 RepID=UPI001BA4600B|nr:hypothetical protein [Bradyrhizobium manausense]MBR0688986.1 hypothetical protein [Bradyrhizobium manausense]MBR0722524.1 hypothetical protein [Bradyrhizobium manausense]MBR0833302.1 hypothetical protein [Bradyrhizobium manausense]